MNAAAWSSSAWQSATIAGPAVGGLLYALGPAVVYGVSGLLLLGSSALVVSIRVRRLAVHNRATDWATVVAGVHFIRRQPGGAGCNLA